MEYLLVFFFQLLGIGFHVMQKIVSLGDKFPAYTVKQIFQNFWSEDWDTLAISGLILLLNLGGQYLTFGYLHIELGKDWYYQISPFVVALILGYAGQRLIYKWFGTAEDFLDKQVSDKLK